MEGSILAKIVAIISGIIASIVPIWSGAPKNPARIETPPAPPAAVVEKMRTAPANQKISIKNEPKVATSTKTILKPKPKPETSQLATKKPAPSPLPPIDYPKALIPLETLNETVRPAMVNILCTTKYGGDFRPISGSGIIIDPHGVILTNAHVAEYFLLKDYQTKDFVVCLARAGSPAAPAYRAELLYLPENWLKDNPALIKQDNPQGTGENDYALLLITGSATSQALPVSLPFVPIDPDQKNITPDVPVLLAGYPSGFLGGIETQIGLWLTTSPASLTKRYYFGEKENIDAFSVGANILAQKGVSGGVAVNQSSGKVEGILTTITEGATTGERELAAISIAHIDRGFRKNTGQSLAEFLTGDMRQALDVFTQNRLPNMTKTLIEGLTSTSTSANYRF